MPGATVIAEANLVSASDSGSVFHFSGTTGSLKHEMLWVVHPNCCVLLRHTCTFNSKLCITFEYTSFHVLTAIVPWCLQLDPSFLKIFFFFFFVTPESSSSSDSSCTDLLGRFLAPLHGRPSLRRPLHQRV